MTAAELTVKVQADISNLTRKLIEAAAEVKAFGDETEQSSSKMKTAWRDAETGLINFDRAQKDVRSGFNNGPLGLVGAIGDGVAAVLKLSGAMQSGVYDFGQWIQEAAQGSETLAMLGGSISALAPLAGVAGIGLAAVAVALAGLPFLAGAAMAILTALADAIGTLGAMAYATLGPLGVLAAILGGLGAAIFLAAKRALTGKGPFKEFGNTVDGLVLKFKQLVTTLAIDFLPLFDRLAHAASVALGYFKQLAQMPLAEAFHSMATKGVKMLTSFLDQVGHVVANPLRLAIQVAFNQGTAQNQIGNILHGIGGFLFGKTVSVPISAHRGGGKGQMMVPQFQPGALQPMIDWFNRRDFTKTGKRWGNEIVTGIMQSGILGRLGNWLLSVLKDAGTRGWHAFVSVAESEIKSVIPRLLTWMTAEFQTTMTRLANYEMKELGRAWDWVKTKAAAVWSAIVSNASNEFNRIKGNLSSMWSSAVAHAEGDWQAFTTWIGRVVGDAWNTVKTKAEGIWNQIISFIERPLSIHINWPSPPSWLSSVLGGLNIPNPFSGLPHTASGGIFTRPTPRLIGESGAEAVIPLTGGMGRHVLGAMGGGGGGVTIMVTGNTFMSGGRPAARELARILKPELDRIVRSGR